MDWKDEESNFDSGLGLEIFSVLYTVQTGSGAHMTYKLDMGRSLLEIKRSGGKTDHSPASSVEVKNAQSYNSTPLIVFIV
jgi:hypothetical protein